MPVIGLTGGIGSGKSTIALFFTTLGYPVYYSDERAKELYFVPEIRTQIISLLGQEAYIDDKTLNKKFISEKIFSDSTLLNKINSIIHPAVKRDFIEWQNNNCKSKYVFKESALLFETGLYRDCYKNILVTAPESLRVERVMRRDHLSREEVLKKLKNQWPDEQKAALANLVLNNDGSVLLIPQILNWLNKLETE